MHKPVDGAEALAREVLLSVLQPGTAAWIAVQSGASLKYHKMRVEQAIPAMLAHSAALVAENERLRAALIAMGRMLPGVVVHDQVSTDFLCELPAEMGHYRLVAPSRALAEADIRLAGVKEGLEMEHVRETGSFLLDRLVDHEVRMTNDEDAREWHGHVTPAMARFRTAIRSLGPRP